jgi:hypothetical protein
MNYITMLFTHFIKQAKMKVLLTRQGPTQYISRQLYLGDLSQRWSLQGLHFFFHIPKEFYNIGTRFTKDVGSKFIHPQFTFNIYI